MSRSGYSDNCDQWSLIRWRGQVASAIKGQRGQRLLIDLVQSLDAMPIKRLIKDSLVEGGEVCALGAVGKKRNLIIDDLDPDDSETVAGRFDIATCLAREVVFVNDDEAPFRDETPEARWERVRKWVMRNIRPVVDDNSTIVED